MRTWKMTAILALAALFVVGVSVVSAVSTGLVATSEQPLLTYEEPVQVVDTGMRRAAIPEVPAPRSHDGPAIPELDNPPTPVRPAVPEAQPVPSGIEPAQLEELELLLHGGDGCPACGMG